MSAGVGKGQTVRTKCNKIEIFHEHERHHMYGPVQCSKKTCATTQKRKKSRFWKRKNVKNVRSFSDHSINSVWVSDQLFNGTSAHYRLFSAMESLITIAIKHIAKKRLLKISVKPKRSCEFISKYGTLNFCCTFFSKCQLNNRLKTLFLNLKKVQHVFSNTACEICKAERHWRVHAFCWASLSQSRTIREVRSYRTDH